MRTFAFTLAAIVIPASSAAEELVRLINAPGVEKVEAYCQACHSLSYIPMNSPFLTPAQWDAEVNKMIKVMGAPIEDADAKTILSYLKTNYGR